MPGEYAAVSSKARRLLLDLVPQSAWGSNLRSRYPEHWDVLRKHSYRRAGFACECCGVNERLECHEIWDYTAPPVQRLVRLIALCAMCHSSHHYGLARVRGIVDVVDVHLMRVNGWTRGELEEHVRGAFRVMRERNKIEWQTDTSALDEAIHALEQQRAPSNWR